MLHRLDNRYQPELFVEAKWMYHLQWRRNKIFTINDTLFFFKIEDGILKNSTFLFIFFYKFSNLNVEENKLIHTVSIHSVRSEFPDFESWDLTTFWFKNYFEFLSPMRGHGRQSCSYWQYHRFENLKKNHGQHVCKIVGFCNIVSSICHIVDRKTLVAWDSHTRFVCQRSDTQTVRSDQIRQKENAFFSLTPISIMFSLISEGKQFFFRRNDEHQMQILSNLYIVLSIEKWSDGCVGNMPYIRVWQTQFAVDQNR